MKLPSINQVSQEAYSTLRRFPFVLLCAAIVTFCALILINHEGGGEPGLLLRILMAAALGLPLLSTFVLYAERKKWNGLKPIALQLIGIALLVVYAFSLPVEITHAPMESAVRFQLIVMSLVLLMSVAPFAAAGSINGFWQYNKTLFFRILATALFSGVLFAGLAVALAALDILFGVDVPGKRYPELWVLIVGIFGTWFFLTGVPKELEVLDQATDYPKGMKIFAQYILAPLVFLYFIILYAYIGKIIITWDWPKGWVSSLILGFSALGISTMLILHPIRERLENNWIKTASRFFWYALIPIQVVLFLAVWRRVGDYGITELRYSGIALAIWLTLMALYFSFSKSKNIKVLPATFCVMALLLSFGPWGMFSFSENNQVGHLRNLLVKNSILVNGQIQKTSDTLRVDDTQQISSILTYLRMMHGYEKIEPWFKESIAMDTAVNYKVYREPAEIAALMGIKYSVLEKSTREGEFTFRVKEEQSLDVAGFDRILYLPHVNEYTSKSLVKTDYLSYRVDSALSTITFLFMREGTSYDSSQVLLNPMIDSLVAEYGKTGTVEVPAEKMYLEVETDSTKARLAINQIMIMKKDGKHKPTYFSGYLLYKLKS